RAHLDEAPGVLGRPRGVRAVRAAGARESRGGGGPDQRRRLVGGERHDVRGVGTRGARALPGWTGPRAHRPAPHEPGFPRVAVPRVHLRRALLGPSVAIGTRSPRTAWARGVRRWRSELDLAAPRGSWVRGVVGG